MKQNKNDANNRNYKGYKSFINAKSNFRNFIF